MISYMFMFLCCICCVCSLFVFFVSSRRRHTRCALVTGVQTCALPILCERPRRVSLSRRRYEPDRGGAIAQWRSRSLLSRLLLLEQRSRIENARHGDLLPSGCLHEPEYLGRGRL